MIRKLCIFLMEWYFWFFEYDAKVQNIRLYIQTFFLFSRIHPLFMASLFSATKINGNKNISFKKFYTIDILVQFHP